MKFILFFCALILCQSCAEQRVERTTEHWVKRSVLDRRPRMITLAMHEDFYVAYDAQHCSLYKVWQGGVHWDGAVYNKIKTIQPESWGYAFYQNAAPLQSWKLSTGEKANIKFKGYEFHDDRITFRYLLSVGEHNFSVFEQPDIEQGSDGQLKFVRTMRCPKLPAGISLHYQDQVIGKSTRLELELEDLPRTSSPRLVSANPGMVWLEKLGCNTCHEMDDATVGPAYRAIASRYHEEPSATEMLIEKVQLGSTGTWGSGVMTPHPHVAKNDISRMIRFILDLEPSEQKPRVRRELVSEKEHTSPGFGEALTGLHPSLRLRQIRPPGFEPRVGGMDVMSDGSLVISTWDSLGAIYRLDDVTDDVTETKITLIASGLAEPLGLKVVDDEIYVLQKHELTHLIDRDGDGLIDVYETVCDAFGVTADFHEFSYGLDYQDGYFYATLGLAMRLLASEEQHADRGTALEISPSGDFKIIARGFRQPNGITATDQGDIFVLENQGQWVPANKIVHAQEGYFYGCQMGTGSRFSNEEEKPPAVWLPQDEIGNSPGQPTFVKTGIYAGQMIHCDVTHGGLKRTYLEQVNGEWQGAVFRFTQGLEAGTMRLSWASPDQLFVGGIGMTGGWGWKERYFGLEAILFNQDTAFEMHSVSATPDGLKIEFTQPPSSFSKEDLEVRQWRYETTKNYGGPKIDEQQLEINKVTSGSDGKIFLVDLEGIKSGHVIYIRLSEDLKSTSNENLWTGECWYTMNQIPDAKNPGD